MRSFVVGALLCYLTVGCLKPPPPPQPVPTQVVEVKPVPITPTPAPTPEQKRTDLPLNWFEVKGDTWSYGLPVGFDSVKHEKNLLTRHYSLDKNLTISLENDKTEANDLRSYVAARVFTTILVAGNKEVLAIKEKQTDKGLILAVQLLWKNDSNGYASSLEFFVEKDNDIYHLSCSSNDVDSLKTNALLCFNVADTLHIK